jgi:hypothetical protein
MSKTIRVRNAPDGVHRMLTARAVAATRGASGLRTATALAALLEVRED